MSAAENRSDIGNCTLFGGLGYVPVAFEGLSSPEGFALRVC